VTVQGVAILAPIKYRVPSENGPSAASPDGKSWHVSLPSCGPMLVVTAFRRLSPARARSTARRDR
jgi:hypothetical protein